MPSGVCQGAQHLAALPTKLSSAVDLFGVSLNEDQLLRLSSLLHRVAWLLSDAWMSEEMSEEMYGSDACSLMSKKG